MSAGERPISPLNANGDCANVRAGGADRRRCGGSANRERLATAAAVKASGKNPAPVRRWLPNQHEPRVGRDCGSRAPESNNCHFLECISMYYE